jgi:hypothetical protein
MQLTLGTFKGLRFAGALLLLTVGVALGVAYWNSVAQHRRYLTSRNFRLLTVLARQTQGVIDGHGRIFSNLLEDPNTFTTAPAKPRSHRDDVPGWLRARVKLIPTLQHLDMSDVHSTVTEAVDDAFARYRIDALKGRPSLVLGLYTADDVQHLRVRLSLAGLLEPIFAPKLRQGAFDTLVFASQDGRVVYAIGRRQHELQWTRLDTLLPPSRMAPRTPFHALARTTAVDEVTIAGVDYKMFIQPCCRQTMDESGNKLAGKGEKHSDEGGMMVAGLVETSRLESSSRAISPTLVIAGVAAVLLAFVSWPFLKLLLLGDQQRITLMDVVQLGTCSVLGLALATIVALTTWTYSRVNQDVDEQLRLLATAIDNNLQEDIGRGYRQLECLERSLLRAPRGGYTDVFNDPRVSCRPDNGASAHYPLMEAFALLTPEGGQAIKASPKPYATSSISVRRRQYFQAVMQGQYRVQLPFCPAGCVVESLRSWNTGVQQAVIAKPTGSPDLPVASLSVPLRSVIGPVTPPGFEYAVVDREGLVLFHSDSQRNMNENLFQETDFDRRLRAVVAARSADALTVDYWGRQYRAYVRPGGMPDWSIVALFDKQGTRGLNLETAGVSVLFLIAYMAVWMVVMLLALRLGATWLWPDPLRRRQYLALAVVHGVLLLAFAAIASLAPPGTVLRAGFCIPMIGWLVTFAVLDRAPLRTAAVTRHPDPLAEYAAMGALLLVLSGIVPAIAFVERAHDLQIESFVKHRQLRLSQALSARWTELLRDYSDPQRDRAPDAFAKRLGVGMFNDLDVYYRFFYATEVQAVNPPGARELPRPHDEDTVLALLEEYLPYYTEFSVEMRELLHPAADDNSWNSQREQGVLALTIPRYTPDRALVVRSMLPTWRGAPSRPDGVEHEGQALSAGAGTVGAAFLVIVGLAGVAYAIVTFVLRHVFLAQLTEPLWASGRLAAASGDNLFVLCDPAVMEAQIGGATPLPLGPIVASAAPEAEWRRALMRVDRLDGSRAIMIADLDTDADNFEMLQRKLAFLLELVENPARTVVVLSQTPLSALNDAIRRDAREDDAEWTRWERVQKALVVLDWRDAPPEAARVEVLVSSRRWWLTRRRTSESLLAQEERQNPVLKRICHDIRQSTSYRAGLLTYEHVLDEIEERALSYYRRVWSACSDEEKVVLSHVAQHGLANAASRRVVRRLLVRGLLFKDPGLRLMNETFGRFVRSAACRAEVVRLEGQCEPSTWDRLRLPLGAAAASAGVFLYLTQKETFDATLSVIGGVTAAIPIVVRTVSFITDRRSIAVDAGRA